MKHPRPRSSVCQYTSVLNRRTRTTSVNVRARKKGDFLTQGLEFFLGSTGFKQPPADTGHRPLEHESNKLWIGRERLGGAVQHSDDHLIEPRSHLSHDL